MNLKSYALFVHDSMYEIICMDNNQSIKLSGNVMWYGNVHKILNINNDNCLCRIAVLTCEG